MTRHVQSAITCDRDGCTETVVTEGLGAFKLAQAQGWTRVRQGPRSGATHVDVCPAHVSCACCGGVPPTGFTCNTCGVAS